MHSIELVGQVATEILRQSLNVEETSDGIARFLLDRLTGQQVAEICRTILAASGLSPLIKIQVPRSLVAGHDLPPEILTDERTVHLRHAPCDKSALLLANTNDDQGQSLRDITRLGAGELKAQINIWVEVASRGLPLPAEQIKYWQKALKGLREASECSLEQFAQYIVDTRSRVLSESVSVIDALGWALPALRLPRDSGYFRAIPENAWGYAQRWQKLFQQAISKRGCLLIKQTPTRKLIDEQDLQAAFNKVRDQVQEKAHSTVEDFIKSAPGWNNEAAALANFEWESDNINSIFSGLRTQKLDLASVTLQFYEDEYPDVLTESEAEYLKTLQKRRTKEANESDQEFYDSHRQELDRNRALKAKWDKFVYGQPIECSDFLVGLIQAFERLFEQADSISSKKSLCIKTQKGTSKSKWLELNADIGIYFCTRYRGIDILTSPEISWETHWLFKYDSLLDETRQRQGQKYKKNTSNARTATEIKFYVELHSGSQNELIVRTQLIWKCNPNAIGMELHDDLDRLHKSPFLLSQVSRELVSKKGRLQGISLGDVGTLMAAFRQDRGSLVSTYDNKKDLIKIFPAQLKKAVQDNRLSPEAAGVLKAAWENFAQAYTNAIKSWVGAEGLSSSNLLSQCEAYYELLNALLCHARGDRNRVELYEPILRLGCVRVDRGKPAAIVAPWHPLRLASLAIKARQVSDLLKHVLNTSQVNFGDSRLFFSDLRTELTHPYYPEVCVGYSGKQPLLLSTSDTVNDYSLLERPIRDVTDQTTNEDPTEAAAKLLILIRRYLELVPHEWTNLSLVLYNCDSIRLPQAVASKLTELQDDQDEARCQVILRHRDTQKLSELYKQMIESSDADPDAFIASEASRDFMARLRIGVMSDSTPLTDSKEGKFANIVFLQDVISRQAKVVWQPSPFKENTPNLLKHVPSRWSRKRPAAKDELKSTVYLVCPSQPNVGQAYLDAIHCVVIGEDPVPNQHFLPARQISFQDEATKTVFEEVHRLGEWVVNYDDLLERRQLVNQGVQVIRYQQSRTDERNFLVSSSAPLNLLQVLVKRRLEALNLGLDEDKITSLAGRLIDEANVLSGDIVLRAAKCGRFASELMGVVLSKALILSEIGTNNPIGWYFLDDYASWLGQKEGQIADILAISPQIVSGKPVLKIIVSEAKYIDAASLADARKTSQKQLRDTVDRIANALFVSPGRLDRDLWLARIGDLLLESIEFSSTSSISIEEWREGVRSGTIPIDLSGYSHVFISGPNNTSADSEQVPIAKVERCFQEIFSREQVRELVLAYQVEQPLSKIREQLGDERPWEVSQPMFPAERVVWVSQEKTEHNTSETSATGSLDQQSSPKKSFLKTSTDEPALDINSPIYPNGLVWAGTELATWITQSSTSVTENRDAEQWLNDVVLSLRNALISYDLQAKVLEQRLTPNAALIRFRGSDRLKIEDIERRRSQLLTTHALDVINVSGQPGELVVSVARPQRQTISLGEVWTNRKLNRSKAGVNLSFVVGVKEIDGELLYLNLGGTFENLQQHAPHTLIAGATGSGKSVLLRNLLLDICATNSKELVNIYLVDSKAGADYFPLEDLPHFRDGIIIEQNHAIEVFENLVAEMDRRYLKFREKKVANLLAYNNQVSENERLPVLWLVHDEFADWMLVDSYKNAVSSAVQRLGVKARAAGIHLIFAAQRPDANVFPVQLRDNLGNRLILKVESVGTSEIALGQKGAERLLGRGHLAARLSGESDIIYAQVPFLSDEEFPLVAEAIKRSQV